MTLHQPRLRLALSLITLSFALVACGGNSHGPTSFTATDDLLSRRKDSATNAFNQKESAERAADEKNIQDFKSAQKQQKSDISASSLDPSSFSANSIGSGGSNFNSANALSGQNWAMMGLAMAPTLMTGVLGLGKDLLTGQRSDSKEAKEKAASKEKPDAQPEPASGTARQNAFVVQQIMDGNLNPNVEVENPNRPQGPPADLRSEEIQTEAPMTIVITMPEVVAPPNSNSPIPDQNCVGASGPFSEQQGDVEKILAHQGGN